MPALNIFSFLSNKINFKLCWPIQNLIVAVIFFLLQLITLFSTHWLSFEAKTEIGKPKEVGHYGPWTLCNIKGPNLKEDCDPLDTFFQVSNFIEVGGYLGILNLILLLVFIPLSIYRVVQIFQKNEVFNLPSRTTTYSKLCLSSLAAIICILIMVFCHITDSNNEYRIFTDWALRVQIAITVIAFGLVTCCAIETVQLERLWELEAAIQAIPPSKIMDSYNPHFETVTPPESRRPIAFTLTSGDPLPTLNDDAFQYPNPMFIDSSPKEGRKITF